MPGSYLIFEDVVKGKMFELLASRIDDAFLQRVFDFLRRWQAQKM